jgi:hypothetical protein
MLEFEEEIGDMLAVFISLRVFAIQSGYNCLITDGLSFVTKVSGRVSHLEYFHIEDLCDYYKRVGGEWVACDVAEFPSFAAVD